MSPLSVVSEFAHSIGMIATPRAALYIPTGADLHRVLDYLAREATARGWAPGGLARTWPELITMMASGRYEVAMVTSLAVLPPDRTPRLVAADEPIDWAPEQRRARRLTRPAQPPPRHA